eukprot:gene8321-biopygen12131
MRFPVSFCRYSGVLLQTPIGNSGEAGYSHNERLGGLATSDTSPQAINLPGTWKVHHWVKHAEQCKIFQIMCKKRGFKKIRGFRDDDYLSDGNAGNCHIGVGRVAGKVSPGWLIFLGTCGFSRGIVVSGRGNLGFGQDTGWSGHDCAWSGRACAWPGHEFGGLAHDLDGRDVGLCDRDAILRHDVMSRVWDMYLGGRGVI